jgi:hypothetical protein
MLLNGRREDNSERQQALACMGLPMPAPEAGSEPEEVFELLPDVALPVDIFSSLFTQMRVGPGGVQGLRYEALEAVMRMRRVPPARRSDLFDDVQVCESADLEHFALQRFQARGAH